MNNKGKGEATWPWKRGGSSNLGMSNKQSKDNTWSDKVNDWIDNNGIGTTKSDVNMALEARMGTCGVDHAQGTDWEDLDIPSKYSNSTKMPVGGVCGEPVGSERDLPSNKPSKGGSTVMDASTVTGDPDYEMNAVMVDRDYEISGLGNGGSSKAPDVPKGPGFAKKNYENHYKKALAKDQASYSLSATTVEQQAAKESNFVGSAYFMDMSLKNVSKLQKSAIRWYFSDSNYRFNSALLGNTLLSMLVRRLLELTQRALKQRHSS